MLAPNNNMGMPYQTDEKHFTNLLEYFVGVIKLPSNLFVNQLFSIMCLSQ